MERFPLNDKDRIEEIGKYVVESQKGSREALSTLIDLTQSSLFRFCLYLTGNQQTAEDLCQDIFVKVLTKIKTIKEPRSFTAWLFKTAKNLYLDSVRNLKISKTDSIEDIKEAKIKTDPQDPEIIIKIRRGLSFLDPEERLILLLIDYQGYSYKEVSEITGLSEGAITSRIHRIRKAFLGKFEIL